MRAFALFLMLVVLLGLCARASKSGSGAKRNSVGGGQGSDRAALPRSKAKSRGKKGPSVAALTQRLGGGLVYRMFREMKTAFGSELEALTLQLTRPADTAVPESALEELHQCFEAEADNAQLTVSLLAKLSRKLVEPSVYTKLKALLCLHRLTESSSEAAQTALLQCVRSLRSEVDSKVGMPFFAEDSLASAAVGNVGEARAEGLLQPYMTYVLDFLDLKGESGGRGKAALASPDRAESVLALIDLSAEVEALCDGREGQGAREGARKEGARRGGKVRAGPGQGPMRQALECTRRSRAWLLKQLQRLADAGGWEEDLSEEMEEVLREHGVERKGPKREREGGAKAKDEAAGAAGAASAAAMEAPAPLAAAPVAAAAAAAEQATPVADKEYEAEQEHEGGGDDEEEARPGKAASAKKLPPVAPPASASASSGSSSSSGKKAPATPRASDVARGLDADDEEEREEESEEEEDEEDEDEEDEGNREKAAPKDDEDDEDEDEDGDDDEEEEQEVRAPKRAKGKGKSKGKGRGGK